MVLGILIQDSLATGRFGLIYFLFDCYTHLLYDSIDLALPVLSVLSVLCIGFDIEN